MLPDNNLISIQRHRHPDNFSWCSSSLQSNWKEIQKVLDLITGEHGQHEDPFREFADSRHPNLGEGVIDLANGGFREVGVKI